MCHSFCLSVLVKNGRIYTSNPPTHSQRAQGKSSNTGSSKKMDGIWNRYNLKSTRRIYTFGILQCSEKITLLDLTWYISICATLLALDTSKRNSVSCHVFWIMSRVTVSIADVILSCRCWIFLIFSAYTMFLMYPPQEKNQVERDVGFEVARVLVHPFQSRHHGISHLKCQ